MTHEADGGTVLNLSNGQIFQLNQVGSRILELLNQGLGESEIGEQLAEEFEVASTTANADLRCFLDMLEKQQLLSSK